MKHEPCFTERIEALDSGPIVPVVYCVYRYYASGIIPFQGNSSFQIYYQDKELIDIMLDDCGRYSTFELTQKTIQQKPCKNAYAYYRIGLDNEILVESIYKYFVEE